MKKRAPESNDLSNLAVSYTDSDLFYELQSPRLIEKSGAGTSYLFDKFVEGISVENDVSSYTDRAYTPRTNSVIDRSNRRVPYQIQPENAIILYKIINPEEIISRCKSRQEALNKPKRITPKSSFVSLTKRHPYNPSRSPVLLEGKSSKLIRNSCTKRLSKSPICRTEDKDKSMSIIDSYRITNSTPEPIRTSLQISSITKNRLKLLRPHDSSKENTTVNRNFNCLSNESTRKSLVRQKDQSSVKLINLCHPAKSNSVKTIPSKVKDASVTSRAHSPIKLLYGRPSKYTVTKK